MPADRTDIEWPGHLVSLWFIEQKIIFFDHITDTHYEPAQPGLTVTLFDALVLKHLERYEFEI